jgi:hypothetical protein
LLFFQSTLGKNPILQTRKNPKFCNTCFYMR